jgi:hypothetical protein
LQDSGGVIAVEWGDIVGDELGDALIMRFAHEIAAAENSADAPRTVTIESRGAQWASRFNKFSEELVATFKVLARG